MARRYGGRAAGPGRWNATGWSSGLSCCAGLTTATEWQWIPAPLLASGVYQGVLESAGIAFTPPSMAEIYGAGLQDGTGEQPGAIGRR